MAAFFLSAAYPSFSQTNKYLVYFTDKDDSPYSITNPEVFLSPQAIQRRENHAVPVTWHDLPPNPEYVDSLETLGATVWYTSRWFNAALVEADETVQATIETRGFVVSSGQVTRVAGPSGSNFSGTQAIQAVSDYGNSATQNQLIGVDAMHMAGFFGQGMTVAVLDAGFSNANTLPVFDTLFMNGRILGTYDFVENDNMVYDDHQHGTQVLSVLAGYAAGEVVGPAHRASYYLFRTEDVASETPLEEVNWLIASEYADSAGADVIVSSLGYNEFDDPAYDYNYSDMDGNTTIITRAARQAARAGILVVVSAGNEGNTAWEKILAPADADSVLAIGAVNAAGEYRTFSSQGPAYDGRIKPDLVALGQSVRVANGNGTFSFVSGSSFACPSVAGLAIGVWQQFPESSNYGIMEMLRASATQSDNPDNLLGYGIPNYQQLLLSSDNDRVPEKGVVYPNPAQTVVNWLLPSGLQRRALTVTIADQMGRKAYDVVVLNSSSDVLRLDIAALPAGMYFLQIADGERHYVKLFSKK